MRRGLRLVALPQNGSRMQIRRYYYILSVFLCRRGALLPVISSKSNKTTIHLALSVSDRDGHISAVAQTGCCPAAMMAVDYIINAEQYEILITID